MSQLATSTAFTALKDFLSRDDFKAQIALALPKHLTADRMLRVALTAALHQPKIAEVVTTAPGKASLMKALLTASQLGLEVDGRQGHLVPFNDKRLGMIIQFMPGYQGLVQIAYNHPKVKSIWWAVVHGNDEFIYEDGLDRKLIHRRYAGDGDPGPLTHAYAVCEMDGGAKTFVCLNKREVEKAKKSSRAAQSDYSPWSTHPEAMWAKTAVRALSKQMPQSNELRTALQVDDEVDSLSDTERFAGAKQISGIDFGHGQSESPEVAQDTKAEEAPAVESPPKRTAKKDKPEPPAPATKLEGVRNLIAGTPGIETENVLAYLFGEQKIDQGVLLADLPDDVLQHVIDNWLPIVEQIKT